jgi:hypothetical protein
MSLTKRVSLPPIIKIHYPLLLKLAIEDSSKLPTSDESHFSDRQATTEIVLKSFNVFPPKE